MATDNNVYELVDTYTLLGQEMKNVYFYQIGSGLSFNAQNLADDWVAEVLPSVLAVQPSALIHTQVNTRNLMNPAETGEVLHNLAGTLINEGDELPPFASAGITLARSNASTRSGKKRVYAGGELYTANGVWDSAILTTLTTLATEMASIITVTLVQRWFPVIVKRILVSAGKYRLPTTLAEATVNPVDGALVSSLVTTQNSRKIGVGS